METTKITEYKTMNQSYKAELKRNKKIVKDICGIIVRTSYYSFEDHRETLTVYEIQMSGEGRYKQCDEAGQVLQEKSFVVQKEEIEKFSLKVVDIMHRFDRVDFFYDDCSGEVELILPGGGIILPRGMAFKQRYIEDAWHKLRDKITYIGDANDYSTL